jgi:sterol desaturase/sphingolipid hydroxylase (fatty acid hydroxylase superfamily)
MNVDPLDPATLVRGVIATAVLFAVIAFFTRATLRRIVGALVGSIPLIPMVMFYDSIAARLGWWRYPSVTAGSIAPFAWYLAAALFYGAGLGLIGWRVIRRYGRRGLIGFLIVFAIFGVTRDYFYSFTTEVIKFGPGPIPLIADLFAYASPAAIVQLVMYWISGPPGSDPLARMARAKADHNS